VPGTESGRRFTGHRLGRFANFGETLLRLCLEPLMKCRIAIGAFSLLLCAGSGLYAQNESLEYEVKAAFLLNFTKFVQWPESAFPGPASLFTVCITGTDPFGTILEGVVQGESVAGHRIAVQHVSEAPAPHTCQMMFAGETAGNLPGLLKSLGPGVLTVGDGRTFLSDGGMIAFVIENRRVRFDINAAIADKAGLRLSSRLLAIARSVTNR
jgi:hypothetical protein